MQRFIGRLLLSLVLLSATHAYARGTVFVSPSVGTASISNIDGYKDAALLRVDAAYFLLPELGVGLFGMQYSDFESSGSGNAVSIKLSGFGPSVTGRWPVHPNVQPYVRLDYMRWEVESHGLGRLLASDTGGSAGLTAGVHFPIKRIFGAKVEVSRYNNVSGADIQQVSVGAVFEF
ncbi:MAG: outer membrane beta-barrel protein [Sideroxyarcus sp.]|nr:outer membrane beta-barrel protein [Sideroxyarcus sp.]